ncbi:polysaccharide deacetylase family protein [Hymenobacter sp. BT186]|uniref:Polysaccharide deacetylase family protein n=1 Tax=Hymenobacter telluris TaxID=2816474 RepID=A0A939ES28_9BACT|nr:polysaccharide deacetylase family protein [Hymenobacter telluris]MBO0356433.1 polysaccharide deacetylase family protein [Hymenobacter telluris]MBW3372457.1 polysaccharide deacetylase family protein [Hymenobacter norwichensis]
MRLHRLPKLLQRLLPHTEWRGPAPEGKKPLYLTFDDGPIPEQTPFVLEQLACHDARATFFCVGENLEKHPKVAQQALAAGHRLANHTYHHVSGWRLPDADYLAEVEQCQQALEHLTGVPEKQPLLRPPYGRITRAQAAALHPTYRLIMWDVLTYDYDATYPADVCLKAALAHTRPGSIVVFHDSQKAQRNLRAVLPRYLEACAAAGYSFEAL